MTVFVKDPDSILDYSIDWQTLGYLDQNSSPQEVLESSNWEVEPGQPSPPELAIVSSAFDNTISAITVSGGVIGNRYKLVNRITTSQGRTDDRSITVRIAAQ